MAGCCRQERLQEINHPITIESEDLCMNKNYDLAVGAKRLEKVTPSLIRTILDRASVLRSEESR